MASAARTAKASPPTKRANNLLKVTTSRDKVAKAKVNQAKVRTDKLKASAKGKVRARDRMATKAAINLRRVMTNQVKANKARVSRVRASKDKAARAKAVKVEHAVKVVTKGNSRKIPPDNPELAVKVRVKVVVKVMGKAAAKALAARPMGRMARNLEMETPANSPKTTMLSTNLSIPNRATVANAAAIVVGNGATARAVAAMARTGRTWPKMETPTMPVAHSTAEISTVVIIMAVRLTSAQLTAITPIPAPSPERISPTGPIACARCKT